ncbi:hypothetical protein RF11_16355 [Thelohanellus kitauei]|uniref:Uncharacterized protein n=1 Tax=Thelohanellus kitauei TaxID=669202 RepID=A0A0C2IE20_THEKT|nr:hypothetical protein RF11_16355 [Thelohanellus kitauei]
MVQDDINSETNAIALDEYISKSQAGDLSTQIEAVRNVISRFSKISDAKAYHLFIDNFPKELFDEFNSMTRNGTYGDSYLEKKKLFFDVFSFIFRNQNMKLLSDLKGQPFVVLLLKFFKQHDQCLAFDPEVIYDSIKVCASQQSNRILFIMENGLFHYHSLISKDESPRYFHVLCKIIYKFKSLNQDLCPLELSKSINQTMTKLVSTKEDDLAPLLFTQLRMIHRLKLLDEIELNVTKFYDITNEIFSRKVDLNSNYSYILYLPKIWSGILNASTNSIQIDTIEKLIFFARIFSVNISDKMDESYWDRWDLNLTPNKLQRYYIIYLTFVAFPIIDHDVHPDLRILLERLHTSFRKFSKKNKFVRFSNKNLFQFLQYYIKSFITLNIRISLLDEIYLHDELEKLLIEPSYKLLCCFLVSQILIDICDHPKLSECYFATGFGNAKRFLKTLILSLSDDKYCKRIQQDQRLSFYQNLKSKHLLVIEKDFLNSLFSRCEAHIFDACKAELPEVYINSAYKIFTQLLASIIHSFHESNILDENEAKNLDKLCDDFSKGKSTIINSHDIPGAMLDSHPDSNSSSNKISLHKLSFRDLLRLFVLIYEQKFIYGDENSKFTFFF